MKTNNNGNNANNSNETRNAAAMVASNNRENEIKPFIAFCKEHIADKLEDYEGQDAYGCDLAYKLTEGMNADGSFTYSTAKAKEYIKEWWDDAADFSEYEDFNFGERSNPFQNPEAFTVKMVIEGVAGLLSKCALIDQYWNDRLELTAENIATIKEQIDELPDDVEVF